MRTTLNLDDDVFRAVKKYAEARSVAMGKALSDLVRRGLDAPVKTRVINGLMVFDLPEDSEPVTSERVKELAGSAMGISSSGAVTLSYVKYVVGPAPFPWWAWAAEYLPLYAILGVTAWRTLARRPAVSWPVPVA